MSYYVNGRKLVRAPEGFPHAINTESHRGMTYEYIKVASDKIGRYLTEEECVHHIDCDHTNNDPDNLMVFATNSDHSKFHANGLNYSILEMASPNVYKVIDGYSGSVKDFICTHCGKHFKAHKGNHKHKTVFCSAECTKKYRLSTSKCPDAAVLSKLLKDNSREAVGRMFGVTGNAVKKWEYRLGLR